MGTKTNQRMPLTIARIRHNIQTYTVPVMKQTCQPPHSLHCERTEFTSSELCNKRRTLQFFRGQEFVGYVSVSEVMHWRLRSEMLTIRHSVVRSLRPINKTKYRHSSVTSSGRPTRPSVTKQILHTKILMYVPCIL